MLNKLYHKRLEDEMHLTTSISKLNDNDNLKVYELSYDDTDLYDNMNIEKIKEKIKLRVNNKTKQANKEYSEEKTLLKTLLHAIPNKSTIEMLKDENRKTILYDHNYYLVFYKINKFIFSSDNLVNHKKHNSDGYIHNIINALHKNKHIPYPILKLNKMIYDLHFYEILGTNRQETSNYLIPRTEIYLMSSTYDLLDFYTKYKLENMYINQAKKQPIEIYLYALQQTLTNNESILGMTKYTSKKVYEYNIDFTSNYLYYSSPTHILRFKLQYVITLEKELLPFTDLNYYLFKVKWNNANPIDGNFVVVVKLDIFNRNHNKRLIQASITQLQQIKEDHTQNRILENAYYDTTKKNRINNYYNTTNLLDKHTYEIYTYELILPNKIKNMLDTPKLTQDEIDELFNPKQLEQQQEETHNITHNIIYSSSDSDSDSDEEKYENIEKPQKTINNTQQPFNLIFKYNKNYYFSNDDKYLIVNAFITKYNTSKKLRTLTSEYEVVMIIKPTHKHYTHIKYFNFILVTHDYTYFTKQYHAYLDADNNITNITEITETIKNVI